MNTDDLVTKSDIGKLKEEIIQAISSQSKPIELSKQGMTGAQVKKALGGVSFGFLATLRDKGILTAKKTGDVWIYNEDQVMALIPDYKKK